MLSRDVEINPASVKQSIMKSAKRLPNFNIFEQGMIYLFLNVHLNLHVILLRRQVIFLTSVLFCASKHHYSFHVFVRSGAELR